MATPERRTAKLLVAIRPSVKERLRQYALEQGFSDALAVDKLLDQHLPKERKPR